MALDMNPEIRAQWCAALRSGEYEQAREELRDTVNGALAYCCLGVLTDLYLKDAQPEEFDADGWTATVWNYDGILAPPVRDWAGLDESNPALTVALTATDVNDAGTTFAEIAALIDGGVS